MTTQMNFGPEWMRGGSLNTNRDSQVLYTLDISLDKEEKIDSDSFRYTKDYTTLRLYDKSTDNSGKQRHEYAIKTGSHHPFSTDENIFFDNTRTIKSNNTTDKSIISYNSSCEYLYSIDGTIQDLKYTSLKDDQLDFSSELRQDSEVESDPLWNNVEKDNIGTFDKNGVYCMNEGGNDQLLGFSLEPEMERQPYDLQNRDMRPFVNQINNCGSDIAIAKDIMNINDANKPQSRWLYRDSIGAIQGPFPSLQMHEWFVAGFFDQSLFVKREDSLIFEPLYVLIQKTNDPHTPFLNVCQTEKTIEDLAITSPGDDLFKDRGIRTTETFSAHYGPNMNFVQPTFINDTHFGDALFSSLSLPQVNINDRVSISPSWNIDSSTWVKYQSEYPFNNTIQIENRKPHQLQTETHSRSSRQQNHMFYQNNEMHGINQQMEQQYLQVLRSNQQYYNTQLQQKMSKQRQGYMSDIIDKDITNTSQFVLQKEQPSSIPITTETQQSILTDKSKLLLEPVVPNLGMLHEDKKDLLEQSCSQELVSALENISISKTNKETLLDPIKQEKQLQERSVDSKKNSATATQNFKSFREAQIKDSKFSREQKRSQTQLNGWPIKPARSRSTVINSGAKKPNKPNTWESPTRQKRVSMNASIPPTITKLSGNLPRVIKDETGKPSDMFLNWCKMSLCGLNDGVDANEILQMLFSFPNDETCSEIIQDIIYANSSSMDGRRFAKDFISGRKADIEGKFKSTIPKTMGNSLTEFKVVTKKGKKKHQF